MKNLMSMIGIVSAILGGALLGGFLYGNIPVALAIGAGFCIFAILFFVGGFILGFIKTSLTNLMSPLIQEKKIKRKKT